VRLLSPILEMICALCGWVGRGQWAFDVIRDRVSSAFLPLSFLLLRS
jgi:hypothetical protein